MRKELLYSGLILLVAACSKVSQPSDASGRVNAFTVPHVLRWANATDVSTLNPHLSQHSTLGRLSSLTMAWLIKFDERNQPYPELALQVPTKDNGGVSKDGLTITYHLRHGVRWSDGAPFTADDVAFSANVVNNPANNEVSREGWDRIAKIEEPDRYTIIFRLKKPFSPFIEVFFSSVGANPCILPKHILGNLPNINNAAYNSLPIGIGPFKYQSWERQQRIVMVPDPNYFRGKPKLHKIIFMVVPDRNTLLARFQAKEIDLWDLVPGNYVARMRQLAPYSVVTTPSYLWGHIDFNLTNPALKDPIVRHALLYALDRQGIIDKIGHGLGTVSDSVTPDTAPYATHVPTTPFDPGKAKALLDEDGWRLGSDGIRAKGALRLSFSYATYTGAPDVDNMIEFVRANWKAIGVEINVHHYAPTRYFAPFKEGGILYGNTWDITSFAWQNEALGNYAQIYSCNAFPPAGQNVPRWCNRKADAAMSALFDHYDQAARNRDVAIVANALAEDAPAPVLSHRVDAYAYNKDLVGFHPSSLTPFDNFMNVDI